MRSYLGTRILAQHGFKEVYNLSGATAMREFALNRRLAGLTGDHADRRSRTRRHHDRLSALETIGRSVGPPSDEPARPSSLRWAYGFPSH